MMNHYQWVKSLSNIFTPKPCVVPWFLTLAQFPSPFPHQAFSYVKSAQNNTEQKSSRSQKYCIELQWSHCIFRHRTCCIISCCPWAAHPSGVLTTSQSFVVGVSTSVRSTRGHRHPRGSRFQRSTIIPAAVL